MYINGMTSIFLHTLMEATRLTQSLLFDVAKINC